MLVLALDSALDAAQAAVYDAGRDVMRAARSAPMTRGQAEALIPLVDETLADAGLRMADIGRIAVTTGPGSFTGLRVAIAAARGFALATGATAVGISTLSAFAAPILAAGEATAVAAAIHARNDNVYLFVVAETGMVLVQPRFCSASEAARAAALGPVTLIGTGARDVMARWPAGEPPPRQVLETAIVDIGWVARLAVVADPEESPARPFYLKAPDTKPQDGARIAREPQL